MTYGNMRQYVNKNDFKNCLHFLKISLYLTFLTKIFRQKEGGKTHDK